MLDKFRETAITWDKANRKVYEPLRASAGDNKGRKLSVQVVNDGVIENLSGASLSLFWETKDKAHKGLDAFTAVDVTKGEFEIYYTTGMLSNEGTLNANLVLVDANGRLVSEPFTITVFKGIDDDAIQSSDSFTALTEALAQVGNINNKADRAELLALESTFEQNKVSVEQQLAKNITELHDLTVNVRRFKKDSNTWNEALQSTINYALTQYGEDQIIENKAIPRNITVKMPKGTYHITTTLNVSKGISFDFNGCTFVASPYDKTIDFMDYTSRIYRSFFDGGNFVGFNTVFKVATDNLDTANMVFKNPVFQSCKMGIDTISHSKSRSTYLFIQNMYSLLTDVAVKTHTDMTNIDGGWVYHTGHDGASIINHGLTEISNIIFVPSPKKSPAFRPRWIDNYTTYNGETSYERGLSIRHCRFGGESGSCPAVFNYAKASLTMSSYKASIINIENTYMTGTSEGSAIVLFDMPNKISIRNVSGLINLTDGLIKPDSSFDPDTIPYSKFISIEVDESAKHNYKLVDDKLRRFIKRYENINDMFRYTFEDGFYGQQGCVATSDGKPKFTFKVRFRDRSTTPTQRGKGMAFLLTISSGSGTNTAYKNISTYIVHASGAYVSGDLRYKLSYEPLKITPGGNGETNTTEIDSLHWGSGDTGSELLNLASDASLAEGEITVVLSSGQVDTAGVSILPLFGSA